MFLFHASPYRPKHNKNDIIEKLVWNNKSSLSLMNTFPMFYILAYFKF